MTHDRPDGTGVSSATSPAAILGPPAPGDPSTWVKSPVDGSLSLGPYLPPVPSEEFDPDIIEAFRAAGVLGNDWLTGQIPRYLHTFHHMPHSEDPSQTGKRTALDLGTSGIFPILLRDELGYERVDFTDFDRAGGPVADVPLHGDRRNQLWKSFKVNLEEELLPVPDETYDLVLCFEIIEHLEKDPMFMVAEINRVLKPGGLVYLTTPNITSARNVGMILQGYAPHFFMKYNKTPKLYRHNIEYAPDQIATILDSGGFNIKKLWTRDLFHVGDEAVMRHLHNFGLPTHLRGDNILVIAAKETSVRDRYPEIMYY